MLALKYTNVQLGKTLKNGNMLGFYKLDFLKHINAKKVAYFDTQFSSNVLNKITNERK